MDFVATVSHELRTPLAVIRSAAQNLSAGVIDDPARAQQYGELIDAEGRRLTEMVEQVLDYAGMANASRTVTAGPIDVGTLAADVLASCRTLVDGGFAIEIDIAHPLPPVMADEPAVRGAIQNLVINAMKYGDDGHWLRLEVRPVRSAARTEVEITVSDRGLGIDPADLAHVFEPFYRGRRAKDAQIHGNGLGLSLVKRTAEAYAGRVAVTSRPGEGASFTLTFPAARADAASSTVRVTRKTREPASAEADASQA
jgi:signal transduction histidine kinase